MGTELSDSPSAVSIAMGVTWNFVLSHFWILYEKLLCYFSVLTIRVHGFFVVLRLKQVSV